MVNEIIGSPGSRIAYEFNFRLLEGILPGKADVTSAALAVTLAASMGQVERAVVVGTPDWHKVVGKMNFKLVAGLGDTFDRSRVMKNLKPRNFGVANRLLSRAATVRYIRYHTLGGYATTKATDQVYAQSLDAVAVADKPQEKKDSIVFWKRMPEVRSSKWSWWRSTLCLKTKVTEAMSYAPHGSRVEWTGVACREGLVGRLCWEEGFAHTNMH